MAAAELRDCGRLKDIRTFIDSLYGGGLHAKRVASLAAATLGAMTGASLAVAMIGQALAQARGLVTKHAIKQVDRLLSNGGIDVWESLARWVPHLVGSCTDIVVAMDWTDFAGDDQATTRRRPGDTGAQPGDRPWPGDAAVVAFGVERRVEGSAQRHRGYLPAALVGGCSARLPGDRPGGSWLRRPQAVGVSG
jgi:hypothetical protein